MDDKIFLKLDGIVGASKDEQHPYEIEIVSWSWGRGYQSLGLSEKYTPNAPKSNTIQVSRVMDRASPTLYTYTATRRHIPNGQLTVRRAGNPLEYLKIRFMDILITSVEGSSQPASEESFTMAFAKYHSVFTELQANGTPEIVHEMGWDFKEDLKW